MNESDIARQLFACAAQGGNSAQRRTHFIDLPSIVLSLARDIATGHYQPKPFTVFAVTESKLREIFAPDFADRLVQQWLVAHIAPWWDARFIDDSFSNRKGKGTQAAVQRLQHFMRQPGQRWYCHLDIRAFFPSIDRSILLALWRKAHHTRPWPQQVSPCLDQVATAIITQPPNEPPPKRSGNTALLALIPPHKSLLGAPPGVGLPIGSLTSQFFSNVYLNELDQFVKHTLKVRGYLRYVDDFVLLADCPQTLTHWQTEIARFLREHLRLELHPGKTVMQRSRQGIDFLGSVVYPDHCLVRQRSVRALRLRLKWFEWLVFGRLSHPVRMPETGHWRQWLQSHAALRAPGHPSPAMLTRMLATINSYYGVFTHAHTYTLRKHIYEKELGLLKTFFMPESSAYRYLRIRKAWLPMQ